MSRFPYDDRPDAALWKRAIQMVDATEIDPWAPVRFTIDTRERVASAGSCFARHIAANLKAHGFNYFQTEEGAEYSANFGNVYTTLQLWQLFERAYGRFSPQEKHWRRGDRYVDPLRPRVFPDGFVSPEAVHEAERLHLEAVRRLFEALDVFVFTLGLTEGFVSTIDGTAFPACPGKDFGVFDAARYAFRNLTVAENVEYLDAFVSALLHVNPSARILLTVSPVPLVATMENRSVLQSTVYSKSVLRVCADELRRRHPCVDYFWSYEIVTATYNNDRYFEPDRRSVTEAGVAHVMRSFFRHFANLEIERPQVDDFDPCDEDVLDAIIKKASL
ncbi:MAG: GSCFA domain-containing protein [Candidatus Eremiobacteraeota bacterium]|nr:GSCFA domain-containing protein [Candidatus Eremiobacteraeota bacterium]